MEYRWGAANADRSRTLAAELLALAPDLILTVGRRRAQWLPILLRPRGLSHSVVVRLLGAAAYAIAMKERHTLLPLQRSRAVRSPPAAFDHEFDELGWLAGAL